MSVELQGRPHDDRVLVTVERGGVRIVATAPVHDRLAVRRALDATWEAITERAGAVAAYDPPALPDGGLERRCRYCGQSLEDVEHRDCTHSFGRCRP